MSNLNEVNICDCGNSHDITFCISVDCENRGKCYRHMVHHSFTDYCRISQSNFALSFNENEACVYYIKKGNVVNK